MYYRNKVELIPYADLYISINFCKKSFKGKTSFFKYNLLSCFPLDVFYFSIIVYDLGFPSLLGVKCFSVEISSL